MQLLLLFSIGKECANDTKQQRQGREAVDARGATIEKGREGCLKLLRVARALGV